MLSQKHKDALIQALQSPNSNNTQLIQFINLTKDPYQMLRKMNNLITENQSFSTENLQLKSDRENLDEINQDLHAKLTQQQAEMKFIQQQVSQRQIEVSEQIKLKNEIKLLKSKQVDYQVLITKQKQCIEEITNRFNSVSEQKQNSEKLLNLTRQSQKSLQEALDKYISQINDQDQLIYQLRKSLECSVQSNSEMNSVVNKLILTLNDNEDYISKINCKSGQMEIQFQALMQGLLNVQTTNNTQEEIMKMQQMEVFKARNELFKQQVEFGQISDVIMSEIQSGDHSIFLLKRDIEQTKLQNKNLQMQQSQDQLNYQHAQKKLTEKTDIIENLLVKNNNLQENIFELNKKISLSMAQTQKYKEEMQLYQSQKLNSSKELQIENRNLKYQLERFQKIQDKLRGRIDDLSCMQSINENDDNSRANLTINVEDENMSVNNRSQNKEGSVQNVSIHNTSIDNNSSNQINKNDIISNEIPNNEIDSKEEYKTPQLIENTSFDPSIISGRENQHKRQSQIQQFITPNIKPPALPVIPKQRISIEKSPSIIQSEIKSQQSVDFNQSIEQQPSSTKDKDILGIDSTNNVFKNSNQSIIDDTVLSENNQYKQLDQNMVNSIYNIDEPSILESHHQKPQDDLNKFFSPQLSNQSSIKIKTDQQQVNPFEQESNLNQTLLEQEYEAKFNQLSLPESSEAQNPSNDASYHVNNYNQDISYVEGVYIPKAIKTGAIRDKIETIQEEQPLTDEFAKQQAELKELRKKGFGAK